MVLCVQLKASIIKEHMSEIHEPDQFDLLEQKLEQITSDPEVSDILYLIGEAKKEGLDGFGGECGAAAIAINNALFEGKGKLVGAFNKAFYEKGMWIGHVAVSLEHPVHGNYYLDGDAQVKDVSLIDSWGMLDPDDPDYAERAQEAGIEWNDHTANEVVMVTLTEAEIAQHLPSDNLDEFSDILTHVCRMNGIGDCKNVRSFSP